MSPGGTSHNLVKFRSKDRDQPSAGQRRQAVYVRLSGQT